MPNRGDVGGGGRRGALIALVLFAVLAGVCAGVLYVELGLLRVLPGKSGLDTQTPDARALTPSAFGAWTREEAGTGASAPPPSSRSGAHEANKKSEQ